MNTGRTSTSLIPRGKGDVEELTPSGYKETASPKGRRRERSSTSLPGNQRVHSRGKVRCSISSDSGVKNYPKVGGV